MEFSRKFGSASRKDIDALLWDKLSDALDENQKRSKTRNLISRLRSSKRLHDVGPRTKPDWRLGTKREHLKKDQERNLRKRSIS